MGKLGRTSTEANAIKVDRARARRQEKREVAKRAQEEREIYKRENGPSNRQSFHSSPGNNRPKGLENWRHGEKPTLRKVMERTPLLRRNRTRIWEIREEDDGIPGDSFMEI